MKSTLPQAKPRFFGVLFIAFITTVCLVSCKKDIPTDVPIMGKEAKVKIINAAQSTGDFYLDKNKVNNQVLAFGESSDVRVASGSKSVSFYANGAQDVSTTINFVSTFSYTAFYIEDKNGTGEILAFEDNVGSTETGKARVRFINLSPNFTNPINVNLPGSTLLVNALGFKETSLDFSIEPNLNLGISVIGASGVKVIDGSEFEAGKVYTVWISGTSNANLSINKITYN